MEKYEYSEQDAKEFAEFLVPLLDFVPDKRPTAGQCLRHPWVASVPRSNGEERTGACDAVQEGLRNIALAGDVKDAAAPNSNKLKKQLVRNEGSHSKK
jgi:serine/threonine protein kinase